MGNACGSMDEAARRDKEINDMLRKERRRLREETKILLLGAFEFALNDDLGLYSVSSSFVVDVGDWDYAR